MKTLIPDIQPSLPTEKKDINKPKLKIKVTRTSKKTKYVIY